VDAAIAILLVIISAIALPNFFRSWRHWREPAGAQADLVIVPCSEGCGKKLLVANPLANSGATVTCVDCWAVNTGFRNQKQDICENCECAMPEGCRGAFTAEKSCRLWQQGGCA